MATNISKKEKIAERLREERKKHINSFTGKPFSQQDLADEIGSKKNTVVNWERRNGDNTIPPIDKLYELAELYDCDITYLLCEHDYRHSIDVDICDATGLSEEAVEYLTARQAQMKKFYERHSEYPITKNSTPDFISYFIVNGDKAIDSISKICGNRRALCELQNDPEFNTVKELYEKSSSAGNDWEYCGVNYGEQQFYDELEETLVEKYTKEQEKTKIEIDQMVAEGAFIEVRNPDGKIVSIADPNHLANILRNYSPVPDDFMPRFLDSYKLLRDIDNDEQVLLFSASNAFVEMIKQYSDMSLKEFAERHNFSK